MRVRMRTTLAGPNGCAWPGDVLEVSDELASRLTKGGYAEAVDPLPNPDPELAAQPKAAPAKGGKGRR